MKQLIPFVTILLFLTGCSMTPKPLTLQEIQEQSDRDLSEALAEQEPVTGPIDMYEAMARAIKYNLESRLKLLETSLAEQQHTVAKFEMLPKMVASAGYNFRDNDSGSTNRALTGPQSGQDVFSTSQDREHVTSDITLMWNVLDFGLSYVRAKQQGDRILIAQERKRKTIQNIIQDIRIAYWKAACAELLLDDMNRLLIETEKALEQSREIEDNQLAPPREYLEYQRALLENMRMLQDLTQRMRNAKTELATLMNIRSSDEFHLKIPKEFNDMPRLNASVSEVERLALTYRPELREENYRARITALETRKAILQAFPSLNLEAGYNNDTNSFLYNNDWWSAGSRVSLNLFKLISQPAVYRAVKAQQDVDTMRRQALSMAILTQVHLAYQGFQQAEERYEMSTMLDSINERLNNLTMAENEAGAGNEFTVIKSRTNALVTKMRKILAYADLQGSLSRVINTVGLDILPQKIENTPLNEVSRSLYEAVRDVEAILEYPRPAAAPEPEA